jgi:hypothetical protein
MLGDEYDDTGFWLVDITAPVAVIAESEISTEAQAFSYRLMAVVLDRYMAVCCAAVVLKAKVVMIQQRRVLKI